VVRVTFTKALERFVHCPPQDVEGATLREVLDQAFAANPKVKGYILDEQGAVRYHVAIFVDGQPVKDRANLTDPTAPGGEVYVMQALSGG
jgi:molybdopterin synthase sulfur carrier subunit